MVNAPDGNHPLFVCDTRRKIILSHYLRTPT
ncbi:hypothetical protein CPT_Shashou_025 [Escherichia phage Shashou]|nr:hypothetical protein CPT_Shashou_025 [Escherichia phage Shashou]DAU29108.1 MAG TPA: hypothetical protein [Caudoviricetes sp.]